MTIVDIATNNKHLSLYRGFVKISERSKEIGRVPLDAVTAVISSGHGTTYSHNLLVRLAEDGTPLFICGKNYQPIGGFLPLAAHYKQTERIHYQINASKPLIKRLHQQIISAKINMQAEACSFIAGKDAALPLFQAAKDVRPGDPDNIEGRAAAYYFPHIFGNDFLRNRDAEGINAMLNYGYTVLRACVARQVCGAGFCPSLGIFHCNKLNAFCLVDDLLEPYRPIIDLATVIYAEHATPNVTPKTKKIMTSLLDTDISDKCEKIHSLLSMTQETTRSLVTSFAKQKASLSFFHPRDLAYIACNLRTSITANC